MILINKNNVNYVEFTPASKSDLVINQEEKLHIHMRDGVTFAMSGQEAEQLYKEFREQREFV